MGTIPYGYCHCGCGRKTNINKRKSPKPGPAKGEPSWFIPGHQFHRLRKGVQYIEEDRGHDTPCWIWQLKVSRNGYGYIKINKRDLGAHRHYYEQRKGEIPEGLTIDHLCRVRCCVNPDHLEAVPIHINQRRGSRTVLNEEIVAEIRRLHGLGLNYPEISEETGIKRTTIGAVVRGENWSK